MLQCKSELFRSSIKLVEALKINTKEELKDMAHILWLSIPTKLRKAEYAGCLASAVLSCPDMWLPRLTRYELTLLEKLVKAGPDAYVEEPYPFFTTTLEGLSFVVVDRRYAEEGKVRYMICDELREAVAPHLNAVLTSPKRENGFRVEQYACGLLNLYGYLEYTDLVGLLGDCLQKSVPGEEITACLTYSALLERFSFMFHNLYDPATRCLQSPMVSDMDHLLEELDARRDITRRKTFSAEEVWQAGNMPLMNIPNPHTDAVKTFMMKRLGYDTFFADHQLRLLWYMAQTDVSPMKAINAVIDGKLSTMQELTESINLLMDYLNACPRWCLKGYSSTKVFELFEKKKLQKSPPRIVPGPNMQAAGMGISPEMQDVLNGIWEDTVGESKVGRNDPCPCGSGKKYKKCCGRN